MEAVGFLLVAVYIIAALAFAAALIVAWVYGLILAFRAHIILGIVCFFIEPAYVIFAVVKWLTGDDLAQKIVDYFSN